MSSRHSKLAFMIIVFLVFSVACTVLAQGGKGTAAPPAAGVKGPAAVPSPATTPPPVPAKPAAPASGNDIIRVYENAVVEKDTTASNVVVVGGKVDVYGHVTGDIVVTRGEINLHTGAVVDGDLVTAPGKVTREPGVTVNGVTRNVGAKKQGQEKPNAALLALWQAISFIILGILAYALFPRRVDMVSETAAHRPWWSLLYGFLALLLILPILVLLLVTVIGIPLIGLELLLYAALLVMGGIGIRLAVGQRIAQSLSRSGMSGIGMIVLGSIVLAIVAIIPVAGALVMFILSLMGMGAAALTWFGSSPDWLPNRIRRLDVHRRTEPQTSEES